MKKIYQTFWVLFFFSTATEGMEEKKDLHPTSKENYQAISPIYSSDIKHFAVDVNARLLRLYYGLPRGRKGAYLEEQFFNLACTCIERSGNLEDESYMNHIERAQEEGFLPAFYQEGVLLMQKDAIKQGVDKLLLSCQPFKKTKGTFIYLPAIEKLVEHMYAPGVTLKQKALIISTLTQAKTYQQITDLIEQAKLNALEYRDWYTLKYIMLDTPSDATDIYVDMFEETQKQKKQKQLSITSEQAYKLATAALNNKIKLKDDTVVKTLIEHAQKKVVDAYLLHAACSVKGSYGIKKDFSLALTDIGRVLAEKKETSVQLYHIILTIIASIDDDTLKRDQLGHLASIHHELLNQGSEAQEIIRICQNMVVTIGGLYFTAKEDLPSDKFFKPFKQLLLELHTHGCTEQFKDEGALLLEKYLTTWLPYTKKKTSAITTAIDGLQELIDLIEKKILDSKEIALDDLKQRLALLLYKRKDAEDLTKALELLSAYKKLWTGKIASEERGLQALVYAQLIVQTDSKEGVEIVKNIAACNFKMAANKARLILAELYLSNAQNYSFQEGFALLDELLLSDNVEPAVKEAARILSKQKLFHRAKHTKITCENVEQILSKNKDVFDESDKWIVRGMVYKNEMNLKQAIEAYEKSKSPVGTLLSKSLKAQLLVLTTSDHDYSNAMKSFEEIINTLAEINRNSKKYVIEYAYIPIFAFDLGIQLNLFERLSIKTQYQLVELIISRLADSDTNTLDWINILEKMLEQADDSIRSQAQKLMVSSGIYRHLEKQAEKNNEFKRILIMLHVKRAEANFPFLSSVKEHLEKASHLIQEIISEEKNPQDILSYQIAIARLLNQKEKLLVFANQKILTNPGDAHTKFNRALLRFSIGLDEKEEGAQELFLKELEELAAQDVEAATLVLVGTYLDTKLAPVFYATIQASDETKKLIANIKVEKNNDTAWKYIHHGAQKGIIQCILLKAWFLMRHQDICKKYGTMKDGIDELKKICQEEDIQNIFETLFATNSPLSLEIGLTTGIFLKEGLLPHMHHLYRAYFLHAQKKYDDAYKELLALLQVLPATAQDFKDYLERIDTDLKNGRLCNFSHEQKMAVHALSTATNVLLMTGYSYKNITNIVSDQNTVNALQLITPGGGYHIDLCYRAYLFCGIASFMNYAKTKDEKYIRSADKYFSACIDYLIVQPKTVLYNRLVLNIKMILFTIVTHAKQYNYLNLEPIEKNLKTLTDYSKKE